MVSFIRIHRYGKCRLYLNFIQCRRELSIGTVTGLRLFQLKSKRPLSNLLKPKVSNFRVNLGHPVSIEDAIDYYTAWALLVDQRSLGLDLASNQVWSSYVSHSCDRLKIAEGKLRISFFVQRNHDLLFCGKYSSLRLSGL